MEVNRQPQNREVDQQNELGNNLCPATPELAISHCLIVVYNPTFPLAL